MEGSEAEKARWGVGVCASTFPPFYSPVPELSHSSTGPTHLALSLYSIHCPSGDHKAVDLACKKAEPKAIKCQKLLVGGAFHTSHMQAAKEAVAKVFPT